MILSNNSIGLESKSEAKQEVDMNVIIDEIAKMNVSAINFYDSIANDIPKNIWLTKYYNKQGDKIALQGIAESIVDIYEYFKNLKVVSPQSDIKLTELKVITNNSDSETIKGLVVNSEKDRLYSFEIANTAIGYDNKSGDAQKPVVNEDIIINSESGSGKVEELSNQVVPAQ